MIFNEHYGLEGKHAFLSPSNYHWINYDPEKLEAVYARSKAAAVGSQLHDLAKQCIIHGVKLARSSNALNSYVNDCIGFKMKPEQVLYFSEYCFGTADAISFRQKKLKIFDLKTGETKASMNQLLVYAAIFCLEYSIDPRTIHTELRIYQGTECLIHEPEVDEITSIIDQILLFDRLLAKIG